MNISHEKLIDAGMVENMVKVIELYILKIMINIQ